MGRCFWLGTAFISGLVALGVLGWMLVSTSDPALTEDETTILLALGCCGSLLFGAFSLYSLSMIGKIGKEKRSERRQQAMLDEMTAIRQQVVSEDDMQIRLASRLWKQGKKTAAIEILEALPHNPRARGILGEILSRQSRGS